MVAAFSPDYRGEGATQGEVIDPIFDERDLERAQIPVRLSELARGFIQPVDLSFWPSTRILIVLEKAGTAKWFDPNRRSTGVLFSYAVLDDSEQGLLGIAYDPKFEETGRFFVNATVSYEGDDVTEISEWRVEPGVGPSEAKPRKVRVLLRVVQPYQNHNAGQLAFGPDGALYIGLGDGGWANDPHGHGQNGKTLLGSMLRILPTGSRDLEYSIPQDNPYLNDDSVRDEAFAIGFRNPWRYSFDRKGRLIVGDVGQDKHEEIDLVRAGENYGWNVREGAHCFLPKTHCATDGLTEPIYEYGRKDGGSVTGGYVVFEDGPLLNKYVFGDFLSGRLWALDLPQHLGERASVYALGRFPIMASAFTLDADGAMYVADYPDGVVYRVEAQQIKGGQ